MPKGARADQVALTAFAGLIPLAPETVRLFHFGELPSGPEVRVCLSCKKTASWILLHHLEVIKTRWNQNSEDRTPTTLTN